MPLPLLALFAPGGTAALTSLFTGLATSLASWRGKSDAQKSAEYEMSRMTNEIEHAMDVNSMAFRAGLISQRDALTNYEYLWSLLLSMRDEVMSISPAQATRLIRDRDYGGTYGWLWRGTFRDQRILGTGDPSWDDGYLVNGYTVPGTPIHWPWSGTLKYGDAPVTIRLPEPLPDPSEAGNIVPTAGFGTFSAGNPLLWIGAFIGLWWLKPWKLI